MFARSVGRLCRPTRRLLQRARCHQAAKARALAVHQVARARARCRPSCRTTSPRCWRPTRGGACHGAALPRDSRRELGSLGGVELEDEFARADVDADGQLTYAEFKDGARHWWSDDVASDAPPTRSQLMAVFGRTAVPCPGFGAVDNALMANGRGHRPTFGVVLGLRRSPPRWATLSNGCGMFLHGTIERFAGALGLPDPRLTIHQRGYRGVKNVKMAAGIVNVVFGCILACRRSSWWAPESLRGEEDDQEGVERASA